MKLNIIIRNRVLFKNQVISIDYSKTLFLVRSAALFTEILLIASTIEH